MALRELDDAARNFGPCERSCAISGVDGRLYIHRPEWQERFGPGTGIAIPCSVWQTLVWLGETHVVLLSLRGACLLMVEG
jgi:hypothetical protein